MQFAPCRCHLLFLQCEKCAAEMTGHCSVVCMQGEIPVSEAKLKDSASNVKPLYQWVSRGKIRKE